MNVKAGVEFSFDFSQINRKEQTYIAENNMTICLQADIVPKMAERDESGPFFLNRLEI